MTFEYFDDLVEFLESDEEVSEKELLEGLKSTDRGTIHELLENYFTDASKGIPDDDSDFTLLFENIRTFLLGLVDDDQKNDLTKELLRFKKWYWFDRNVKATDQDGDSSMESVAEALALHRLELLGEEKYQLDFSAAMDFPIDTINMEFGVSRIDLEQDHDDCCEEDDCDCGCEHDHEHHHEHHHTSLGCECDDDDAEDYIDDKGWDTLVNKKNPVIDGEFSDSDVSYDVKLN